MLATRDEGASLLQAPAAAAKEEQLERHNNSRAYQPERTRGCAPPARDLPTPPVARGAALRGRENDWRRVGTVRLAKWHAHRTAGRF